MKGVACGVEMLWLRRSQFLGGSILSDLQIRLCRAILKGKINEIHALEDEEMDELDPDYVVQLQELQNVLASKSVGGIWQEAIRRMILTLSVRLFLLKLTQQTPMVWICAAAC